MTDYYTSRCLACFHPGGYELTKHAAELAGLKPGMTVCDIGCGSGYNIEKLFLDFGVRVTGVEPSAAMRGTRTDIISGTAESTGLPDESFDCVLCECVLSLCNDLFAALSEISRILKPRGTLIISDVFSGSEDIRGDGLFGWFYRQDKYIDMIKKAGFNVRITEDQTRLLQHMCAQLIFDGADSAACDSFLRLRTAKCGYFLTISKKEIIL